MKIGFDAKRLFNNFTGLGNYSRFVVNALLDFAPEHEYLLYSPRIKDHPEISAITAHEKVTVVTPPALYTLTGTSSVWRSWGISRERTMQALSVYHGLSQELPRNLPPGVRKVVTIHDLIFLRFPKLYTAIDAKIYLAKVKHACQTADQIVAISEQTAEDVMNFLAIQESKIRVVYQGCHAQFNKRATVEDLASTRKKYGLPEQYLLNVGTVEARKNIVVAIKALALMERGNRLPLVIIGKETAYKQEVVNEAVKLGVNELLIFLHDVTFSDLPAIYQGARVFIYPSLFEGFGIPIIEAIESGVPVITSTGSCFKEAGGPGAVYVDPSRAEELAFQITRMSSDENLRNEMIVAGKKYSRVFAPPQIARQLLNIYQGSPVS